MDNVNVLAKRGIKVLLVRQVFLHIFTFVGGVILARVLGPAQFGLFAIASFWVGILALVGDFGVAPSFVQRRDELTDRDIQVTFTLQQIIITVVVLALFLCAPWLAVLYPSAPHATVWLVRALAGSLYLSSWRAMSALQLERRLQYKRLAWVEVVESLSYQGVAVGLALTGGGVWSLVCAVLVRGLLGTILVYLAAPWKVRLAFDRSIARQSLRYGVPFLVANVANQAASWITPVLVATLIGPQAVGFLTWAANTGNKPLILVDNLMRVAFSHFSRLQDDRDEVERVLVRYLTYLLLPAGLWLVLLLAAGPSLTVWIYSRKWAPAVPALMMVAAAAYVDVAGWVVAVALNGLGRVTFTARIIAIRSVATIALSIPAIMVMGYNGVPLVYLLTMIATTPMLWMGLERGGARRVLVPVAWVIVPLAVSTVVGLLVSRYPLPSAPHAALSAAAALTTYLVAAWITGPRWLTDAVRSLITRYVPARIVRQVDSVAAPELPGHRPRYVGDESNVFVPGNVSTSRHRTGR